MAHSNPKPPTIKPSSFEKQSLRQQQVQRLQKKRKHSLDDEPLPIAAPIDDKYIFGLANPLQIDAQSKVSNSDPPSNTVDDDDHDNDDDGNNVGDKLNEENRFKAHEYSEVWESKEFIDAPSGGTFCCYSAGTKHSDLVFVCLHGCGHSALSYSLMAKIVAAKHQIFSFDYRGHGYSTMNNNKNNQNNNGNQEQSQSEEKEDIDGMNETPLRRMKRMQNEQNEEYKMSKDNLVGDIVAVIRSKYGTKDPPPIVLVGHSLGGALAVHCAQKKGADGIPSLVGIVVIDLVEGTALNSLRHMRSIINRRPKRFGSMEDAIRFCVTSRMIRNVYSAQISVPPMMVERNGGFEWRTDVLRTERYWREWFLGLSELFLKAPVSKMLMLADTDRLDKPLTIGQMQGKYEMCIVGCGVGHTLHEDAPKKVADKLLYFAERNQFIKLWAINKKFKLKK